MEEKHITQKYSDTIITRQLEKISWDRGSALRNPTFKRKVTITLIHRVYTKRGEEALPVQLSFDAVEEIYLMAKKLRDQQITVADKKAYDDNQ